MVIGDEQDPWPSLINRIELYPTESMHILSSLQFEILLVLGNCQCHIVYPHMPPPRFHTTIQKHLHKLN